MGYQRTGLQAYCSLDGNVSGLLQPPSLYRVLVIAMAVNLLVLIRFGHRLRKSTKEEDVGIETKEGGTGKFNLNATMMVVARFKQE